MVVGRSCWWRSQHVHWINPTKVIKSVSKTFEVGGGGDVGVEGEGEVEIESEGEIESEVEGEVEVESEVEVKSEGVEVALFKCPFVSFRMFRRVIRLDILFKWRFIRGLTQFLDFCRRRRLLSRFLFFGE